MDIPETHYADSNGVHIAWQSFGDGPLTIVYVPGWFTNVELTWENPWLADFLTRLGSFARVLLFDKRGTGLSDRDTVSVALEDRMDDMRVVMDAADVEKAALVGSSEGGPMCVLFAATYPARTHSMVLMGAYARRVSTDEYPWGASPDTYAKLVKRIETDWGTALDMSTRAPSLANNPQFAKIYARNLRMSGSPATALKYARMNGEIDVTDVLPVIRVPTLVMHAARDRVCDVGNGRYLASKIPAARLHEVECDDHLFMCTRTDETVGEIQQFLTGSRYEHVDDGVITTILFTDIVGSTEKAASLGDLEWSRLLGSHNAELRGLIARFRGKEVKSTGDGIHATFDGPARAVRCASQMHESVRRLGLTVRIGLHTGECVATPDGLEGIAVHIAARVTQAAAADQTLVSQTVRDLVAGSEISFGDFGEHELKGIPGLWRLYEVFS